MELTTDNAIWLVIGLIIGAVITLGSVALVAIGSLGDEPLPEIEPPRRPQYQD